MLEGCSTVLRADERRLFVRSGLSRVAGRTLRGLERRNRRHRRSRPKRAAVNEKAHSNEAPQDRPGSLPAPSATPARTGVVTAFLGVSRSGWLWQTIRARHLRRLRSRSAGSDASRSGTSRSSLTGDDRQRALRYPARRMFDCHSLAGALASCHRRRTRARNGVALCHEAIGASYNGAEKKVEAAFVKRAIAVRWSQRRPSSTRLRPPSK